ncbi:MAG: FHA domain-containing protein [Paludibacteraceae bacterium]|nr:FHA domain-containing protein [Paludibacteraceae bacterium]
MRCKNCGWENPDHLTRCEKCNTPLESAPFNAASNQVAPQSFNRTVNEAAVFPSNQAQDGNVCPECGYPMRPGVTVCPNCHYGDSEFEQQHRPIVHASPAAKQVKPSPGQGTVNPWVQVAPANKCKLDPIAQDGIDNPNAVHLKGDMHELNRANLDPENQTITSRVQACLTCEDGQWFIEDKSAQHTTFVYAGEKTALKDGDVVLMGNRQFVFHIEN